MLNFIRAFRAFGAIEKLREAYIHQDGVDFADTQAKIINAGISLSLGYRPVVVRDLLRLNIKAVEKGNLHAERATENVLSASKQFGFDGATLTRCVLVPYVDQYQRDLESPHATATSRVLQPLFARAADGKAFENSQVIVSGKLGPSPESICIAFKYAGLVIAENRALPAAKMFVHIDQEYGEASPFRRPYLGFIADFLTRRP